VFGTAGAWLDPHDFARRERNRANDGAPLATRIGRMMRAARLLGSQFPRSCRKGLPREAATQKPYDGVNYVLHLGTYPTPLQELPTLSTPGLPFGSKRDDLTNPTYGGNKVRKLERLLADARRRGANRIVTGARWEVTMSSLRQFCTIARDQGRCRSRSATGNKACS